jgi:hypothetical protein
LKRELKLLLILILIVAIIAPTAAYELLPSPIPTVSVANVYNSSLHAGQSIIVNVTVSNVPALIAVDVNLAFDPSVLKVTTGDPHGYSILRIKYDIYEGSFFKSSTNKTMFYINDVNNHTGIISAIYNAISVAGISSSGSGVVASINFTCVNATSNTAINITGTSILQPITTGVYNIEHQVINGVITADAPPAVWTELWFQATLIIIIVEITVVAVGIFIATRWWRSRVEEESKESTELEDLFR